MEITAVPVNKVRGRGIELLVLVCLLIPCNAGAQSVSGLLGEWQHVTLEEPPSSRPSCRYFDVTTRIYSLENAPNGLIQGAYFHLMQRYWFVQTYEGCNPAERPSPNPDMAIRNDGWLVTGDPIGPQRIRITGRYSKCLGSCDERSKPQPTFETELSLQGDNLSDAELHERISGFRRAEVLRREAQAAADALYPLLRPLLQGNCNAFYVSSTDSGMRESAPQDQFCASSSLIRKLIPAVSYDEPRFAVATSIGSLHPLGMPLLFGDSDVLAEHVLTRASDGSRVGMAAILRRQSDGSWRIWRLMP